MSLSTRPRKRVPTRELVIFALLGALMALSDVLMEGLPNIHIVGLFIAAITCVYRVRALFPVAVYVVLIGATGGFGLWWLSYLYAWPLLWGLVMLVPRRLPRPVYFVLVHAITTLHGLAFGVITAPVLSLMWGLDFHGTVTAVIAGFSFDLLHALGNFVFGFFIAPLSALLSRLSRQK